MKMNRGAPSYPDMPPKVGQKTFGGIFIPDMDISPPTLLPFPFGNVGSEQG